MTAKERLAEAIEQWLTPPSDETVHQWAEARVDLSGISQIEGPYRSDVTPFVRPVFDALQNKRSHKVVCMCSAQSGKTQTMMVFVAWAICEAPGPMFWVAASEESCEEFTKARLLPLLETIPDVAKRMPLVRTEKTLNLIQFASMPLYFRGANSPSKLKSTPVRWLVGDEVDDWKPGSLEKVMKRVRTYRSSKVVLISTPMNSGGDMHTHWLAGTQTFFHFACPACGHRQPFRFGRERSILFPAAREQGGLLWEVNDTTRPGGQWNWRELRQTVRYQCEHCPAEFRQAEQFKLLQTLARVDTNPTPEPGVESFAWSALYSIWVKWDDIAAEFLAAKELAEAGNQEPLKSFVRETLGEPWHIIGEAADTDEILRLAGKYKRGEFWQPIEKDKRKVTRIIGVDVQQDHLRFVLCHIREGGELRVVDYGKLASFEDLRAVQERSGVNRGVFIDSSGTRQTEILRACVQWGWIAMRGSSQESFAHKTPTGRILARPFRTSRVDPFVGTAKANTRGVTRIEWANSPYKDRLYLYALKGKGPRFEIPADAGPDFVAELMDEKREPEKNARGSTVWKWRDSGKNHYGDCLLECLVAMDVTAFSRGAVEAGAKEYELRPASDLT